MSTHYTHATLLAFDYGLRHIGVAVGQTLIASSNPIGIVRARDGVPDWNSIAKFISEWQPNMVLVGLPLNMDGSDSAMSLRARKFSRQLQEKYKIAVELVDERLSSFAAKQARKEAQGNIDFGRDTVDAEAACILLQDYYRRTATDTPQ
ncbi:MAG: Holliday junction resolvase RuvX [Pseudomonadales bacterium]|jgi:putative Holliday junction resolvase